jgi:hypothetical protein
MTIIEDFARWCQPRARRSQHRRPGEHAMIRHGLPCMMAVNVAPRPMGIGVSTPPAQSKLGSLPAGSAALRAQWPSDFHAVPPITAGRQACFSHPNPHQSPFTHRPVRASPRVVLVRLSYACRRPKPFDKAAARKRRRTAGFCQEPTCNVSWSAFQKAALQEYPRHGHPDGAGENVQRQPVPHSGQALRHRS